MSLLLFSTERIIPFFVLVFVMTSQADYVSLYREIVFNTFSVYYIVKCLFLGHFSDRPVFVLGNTLFIFTINYYLLLVTTNNSNNYSKLDGVLPEGDINNINGSIIMLFYY